MKHPNPPHRDQSIDVVISVLQYLQCRVGRCGSRVTCNPPPRNTDADYLVEIIADERRRLDAVSKVIDALSDFGFEWEGNGHYQDGASTFMSWRRGEVNLIVTSTAEFAEKHRLATRLCTKLNLMNKVDRIALFQAILYGADFDPSLNKAGPAPPRPELPELSTAEPTF
ncbi:hypothetical protein BjapCC829_21615 [Bradyrhizobium barranii]|uniref:Uncharacterized protein n=1 Tax=Bradyrhizobium barranii TaxID=2992140 RepID=A0ABY3QY78_9BRAD|nr:hypothetical protein [Bradyrhizobium japonicum]UFW90992.1 hypothetical protein BjapCC829_21615 [Bradyrhizobium japonicum]